ncbi:MAG: hypothetical protein U9N81_13185 [Bacillota bacterium]|nr:hypothetical protein [Bacillota bacterium]
MIENDAELDKLLYKSIELADKLADNRDLCNSVIFHEIIKIATAVVGTFGKY